MRILIVDDDRAKIKNIIDYIVEKCDVFRDHIDVAQNGIAARKELNSNRYDLLILDILLPLRDEDIEANARTSLDLLVDIHRNNVKNVPGRILGLTGFDSLSADVIERFRENAWTVVRYRENDDSWQAPIKNTICYIQDQQITTIRPTYGIDLCVVTALASPEFEQMLRLDWAWGNETPLDDHVFVTHGQFVSGGRTFKVAMCCAPRMGMVATALLSARMIEKLRPRYIAMTGICAGIESKTGIGDILCAETSWNWQSGKHATGELGPYFGAAPHPIGLKDFIASRMKLMSKDSAALLKIKKDFSGTVPPSELRLIVSPVASGSAVIADAEIVQEIQKHERALVGIEMEIYGLYAAATYASLPRPTPFAMKSVCDFGTKIKNDEYQAYAAHTSARAFALFCERYFSEISEMAGT